MVKYRAEKRAGRRGERIATEVIKGVLREGDYLFTNISVSYDGKRTELDDVVVNKYGVFIITAAIITNISYNDDNKYSYQYRCDCDNQFIPPLCLN